MICVKQCWCDFSFGQMRQLLFHLFGQTLLETSSTLALISVFIIFFSDFSWKWICGFIVHFVFVDEETIKFRYGIIVSIKE